ncbi:CPBP family intramembrane metalloprotease [Bacillus cereus group sp. RP37]|uniref:CPBP family intramembrane glutamic endopeptidase n=2 Tax=Bacillus TaxID=1386 RepID=UPI00320D372C|nr:CPBP family intramembrane metalloprotease [Bacillus cereus]
MINKKDNLKLGGYMKICSECNSTGIENTQCCGECKKKFELSNEEIVDLEQKKLQTNKISWIQFVLGIFSIGIATILFVGVPLEITKSLEFIQKNFSANNIKLVNNFLLNFFNLLIIILFISIYKPFRRMILSIFNIKPLYSFRTYIYIFLANLMIIATDNITYLYFSDSANIQDKSLGIENLHEKTLIIYILTMLSIVVIGPICEEILYRGIIIKFFEVKYSFVVGLIISSLLFGIAHNYDIGFIIFATIMGIMYSLLYNKTNSLFPCIIAHITYNLYAFL